MRIKIQKGGQYCPPFCDYNNVLTNKYGAITEFENVMTITKDELPDNTLNVYHITNTHKYR